MDLALFLRCKSASGSGSGHKMYGCQWTWLCSQDVKVGLALVLRCTDASRPGSVLKM